MLPTDEKGTILYVEDNPDNRMLVRRILLSEDYNLLEAVNAADALEVLKTNKPDLILMDINMPDMDGLEATRLLKEQLGHARTLRKQKFALDVAVTNPGAQRLYERLGMQVVRENDFHAARNGVVVPATRRMELLL